MLHFGVDAGQVLDRPEHKRDVGDKRLDAADRHAAQLGLQAAVPDDATHGHRADELYRRQKQGREPGRPVGRAVHLT